MAAAWKGGLCAALFVAVTAVSAWAADAAPPPIEHYTKRPEIDGVVVSPSGKRLALKVFAPNGRRRLAVMNLDPVGEPRIVAGFGDADITTAHWVNEDRLVFEAYQDGAQVKAGGAGTYAVNHDGSDQRHLIAWLHSVGDLHGTRIASKVLPFGWYLDRTVDDGSNDVFVSQRVRDSVGDLRQIVLARLDTMTRELRLLSHGMPEGARRWLLDDKGQPRALSAYRAGMRHIYLRSESSAPWSEIASFDPLAENNGGFDPWHVDAAGRLLVTRYGRGGTTGIYRFDAQVRQVDPEPLISVTGFDLDAEKVVDGRSGNLVGVHFTADRPMSYWFDAGLDRIQRSIDAALPAGRSNRLYCGRCETSRFIVVRSSSDRHPGEYFLYDRSKPSIQQIGASRPWIDEATQGHRRLHRVAARDGLELPVYVTYPAGAAADKPLPAVVLVHGGPWVRGASLAWHAEAQFLASRGYRVLEPEFRGSTGYGYELFRAGWKQWGLAMQDDLADTVQWAAKQGLIDPSKVCVMGASYGGYAALMSPIAHPGVYRCAISFAGVTDIGLMYSIHWSDFSEATRRYSMPVLIGDLEKDKAMLAAASPVKRAGEIKVPVLLAHGGVDRRVPIEHAREFAGAAKRGGVSLEAVEYLHEGHGFFEPPNRTDFYRRVERFLHKALREPPPAQAATDSGASLPR